MIMSKVISNLKALRRIYLKHKREFDIKHEFKKRYRKAERELIRTGKNHRNTAPNYLIGPTNSAGQADQWARILRASGDKAKSLRVVSDLAEFFEADIKIPRQDLVTWSGRFQLGKRIFSEFNIFCLESLRPILGLRNDGRNLSAENAISDLKLLKRAKIKTAVIFHGSDIRDTDYHVKLNSFSPFRDAGNDFTAVKEKAIANRAVLPTLLKTGIPIFVTTPDLFHEVPSAKWLPVTIDYEKFNDVAINHPAFSHSGPPKILYLPSKGWIKSKGIIEPVLAKLDEEKVIDWLKVGAVPHAKVPDLMAQADVVIDRLDGVVGVFACEAMAAGRLVLAHLASWAYENAEVIPPVINITPENLEEVLRNISMKQELISEARAYAKQYHDGEESAKRLKLALAKN
jgi:hypothetical protein